MISKRNLDSIAATWLAGALVVLPLGLTLAVVGWLLALLNSFLGPATPVGRVFAALGAPLAGDSPVAYLVGTIVLVAAMYPIGLAVQAGLKRPLQQFADRTLRRVPLLGTLYDLADRTVALLDRKQAADLRTMSAVWCLFGGQAGSSAAVLALAPSADTIQIGGHAYRAVLVPTAPVPIGGGLLYVPAEWIQPAQVGIDRVMATYVSMGLTPPTPAADARATRP